MSDVFTVLASTFRTVRSLNRAQRIILVIASALALEVAGAYIVTLGDLETGWVAYAPLSGATSISSLGLSPWLRLLVWLGLTAVWASGAVWLLRSPPPTE